MKTLIELYDERPIENVLAADVFRPDTVVYLCPAEALRGQSFKTLIESYFRYREEDIKTVFLETSLYYADKVKKQLKRVTDEYPDCVLDITGGTDAALYAGGLFCAETDIPTFTYSRKRNRFYNINSAEFLDGLRCEPIYDLDDFFKMAGGSARTGRAENEELIAHEKFIDRFFAIYLIYRREWVNITNWFQRASAPEKNGKVNLHVESAYSVKAERGGSIQANETVLKELENLSFISNLKIKHNERVSFDFKDEKTRFWMRDTGSVLGALCMEGLPRHGSVQ